MERFPRLALAAVAHPLHLGFAEAVMGPVVQLDSVVLAGDAPVGADRLGEPVCWHRDRFGFFPHGVYTRPLSLVFLAYLQEMTDQVGPLRVIPGSHTKPIQIPRNALTEIHPDEVLIRTGPGDVVAIHHNLLHSGTRNASESERRFLGFIYNVSSLMQEDNFAGPNCQALIATARRTNDRRMLRLLGEDPLIFPRQNSGFVSPEAEDWARWQRDDEQYAAKATSERATVEQARKEWA